MYAPFHSSRAVCTPGRCSGAWSLLFYKKGTCLSRGFHQLFTKEWGEGGFCPPLPSLSFLPPIPPPPFPGGEGGELRLFHARGFAPCIPATEPVRHLQNLPSRYPAGACLVCRLPTLPFAFLFPPIPPTPFPGGEGGNQGYFMQGASPLASPRLNPGGTYTTKGFCLSTGGSAGSQGEGGTGGDGTIRRKRRRRLRWSSPPGQGQQVPRRVGRDAALKKGSEPRARQGCPRRSGAGRKARKRTQVPFPGNSR